jgi:hypothetical protein
VAERGEVGAPSGAARAPALRQLRHVVAVLRGVAHEEPVEVARKVRYGEPEAALAAVGVGGPGVEQLHPPGRGRCVSIFLDKNRRYIGKPQSKWPPERTPRPPHPAASSSLEPSAAAAGC